MNQSLLMVILAGVLGSVSVYAKAPPVSASSMSIKRRVSHLFDRLAFGARPGEAEKLERQGVFGIDRWIANQLHPESIDDQSVEQKIARLKSLTLSPSQLLTTYKKPLDVALEMGIKKEDFEKNEDLKKEIRQKIGEELLPEAIARDLTAQRLVRAVESRRQLQEVLVDFWLNHFNIDISKGEEKWILPQFEREVIRKKVFGKFGDLLLATAKSPAMLYYLDNQVSESPLDYNGKRDAQSHLRKRNSGLNENYARELLELHTLGVDGGYHQLDVTELARILTGWGIDSPKEDPNFKFKEKVHDRGEKVFLDHEFSAEHGIDEGERAVKLLAEHPSTAHFIAFKLARYFVTDQPPSSLVDRLASVFIKTGGDLRSTYTTLFKSPEFWSRAAYRAKVKRPVQFVVSSIRALGGELDLRNDLYKILSTMGEEPYKCAPPTGYSDTAEAWVNPGAMVSRLNFALKLAANRIDGVYVQLPQVKKIPDRTDALVRKVQVSLLHDQMSENSEKIILHEFEGESRTMADGEIRPISLSKATGLILGSPEFQRR